MNIIENALKEGRSKLSEYEAAQVLSSYGIPMTRQILVRDRSDLADATRQIGFPVVVKACAPDISHKTEQALIRLDLRTQEEAETAFDEVTAGMNSSDRAVLVQEMVKGARELMVGLTRDPQFGPCVMFGLGGIFTEILKDVSFRLAPLETRDAMDMMLEIKGHKILDAVRGMERVDLNELARILISVGRVGLENEQVKEIDINPLIIRKGTPVAVDALIVLQGDGN